MVSLLSTACQPAMLNPAEVLISTPYATLLHRVIRYCLLQISTVFYPTARIALYLSLLGAQQFLGPQTPRIFGEQCLFRTEALTCVFHSFPSLSAFPIYLCLSSISVLFSSPREESCTKFLQKMFIVLPSGTSDKGKPTDGAAVDG